jgi:hypothetical protein
MSALTDASRLALRPLTVVAERDEYVIGDPATGRFFAVPPAGLLVLGALRDGKTIGEAATVAASPGEELDVLDFADVLVRAGFVAAVDGHAVGGGPAPATKTFNPLAGRAARALFSEPMIVLSGVVLLATVAVFAVTPPLRPKFEDLFMHPQPAISFAVLFGVSIATGMLHELCHWWAARGLGVPARIRLSRRLYIPVMETDVSGLWSLPARQRYGPFLAGMVCDVLTLAIAVALRLAWSAEVIDLSPTAVRILGAFVTLKVFELTFQFLVFLRTDLYAVMITALGARNLDRVTRLRLKAVFGLARPRERAELADAHPRDLAASRWYAVFYVLGLLWAVWFFKAWFYPSTFVVATWMGSTLGHAPAGSGDWWQAVLVMALVSTNVIWPLAVYVRQRRGRVAS